MNKLIHLSITKKDVPIRMDVVQGATAPSIDFILDDYIPASGATARLYIKKTDTEVYNDCTISDNVITYAPTTGSFDEVGKCKAQLQIIENGAVALSFIIYVDVTENLIDGSAIESSSEYNALIGMTNDINVLESQVAQIIAGGSVDPSAELVDIRIAYDGTTYPTAGDAVRAQAEELARNLINYNIFDLIGAYGDHTRRVKQGITFEWDVNNPNKCHVSGTSSGTSSNPSIYNIFASTTELPEYFTAGETYYLEAEGLGDNIYIQIFYYINGSSQPVVNLKSSGTFTIPETCTGIVMRIRVTNGVTVDDDVILSALTGMTTKQLADKMASRLYGKPIDPYINNDTLTLSDVTEDGFYVIPTSVTVTDIPEGMTRVTALTVENFSQEGISNKFRKQIAEDIFNASEKTFYRFSKINGTEYYAWREDGGGTTNEYTFNEYQNTYNVTSSPTITADTNNYLAPTGDNTDVTADIVAMLTQSGVCRLGGGDYYVSNLEMPEGTTIIGSGQATRIILLDGGDFAVKLNTECLLSDVALWGALTDVTPTETIGTRHGILWQGTYTASQQYPERAMVSNVWVKNFTGGGITCYDSGPNVRAHIKVTNATIFRCGAGINISYYSEFHKFTNVSATRCYYGCINNGGNNVFVNCDFSSSIGIAFLMDNAQSQSPNNSHGSAIGCVFNHTASNTGIGIKILNCDNGFVFNGCQIFYSQIHIEDSNGVTVSDSNFGTTNCDITISGGGVILFDTNLHGSAPTITVTDNTMVHFNNCYVRSSGAVVSN